MRIRTILVISIFFTTISVSIAQKSELRLFGAHLNEDPSKEAVQFGAVKNIKTGEVTLSNEEGYFEIYGSVGDTLRFHSLGYRDTTWIIPGIWFAMEEDIQLKVQPNIYSLSEVNVVRYYSYAHFKQAFKDLKLEKTEKEKAKEKVDTWQKSFADAIAWGKSDAKVASGTFGVSLSMGTKDKVVAQRKEVDRLLDIQDKSKRFNYFVSRDNIARLTDYKGTCLDSFMVFLNTSYHLHYQMQEYELLSSILRASANFKDLKGEEDWFVLPTD
ncbi:hypothetical protein [Saccharicrinis fermentans]|uniref:Uncharacterized protein n=1 Tax=Saccharicrinis fermentans DSM 9555 = JCM 21142 TaxID=869213 RepID=W7XUZ4_9BACT|nr:hypothetical protein [Saccharicrinis fermentans]GAF01875.1 hypothetical protein JCM21142_495 [Saccharicrinis fermentans DSM 9555 = JCM 21142]